MTTDKTTVSMPDGQTMTVAQLERLALDAARDLRSMHDSTGIDLFDRIPGALALVRAVYGGASVHSHGSES